MAIDRDYESGGNSANWTFLYEDSFHQSNFQKIEETWNKVFEIMSEELG